MAVGNVLVSPTCPDSSAVAVRLQGEIDAAAGADLRSILIDVIMHCRPARILIDLREVTAVDASVIGTLQAAYDLARDADLAFAIDSDGSPLAAELGRMDLP
ncbi:STAS domain-containing protein [Planosporangium thailandense]|uniref:STAS domain-containing protein n=1 Tax=Planosporangium thailandense TaxID=765197 RepID=A0ABX0Y0Y0_9ACTN|nr:STAS domain-containing protein [Planosporangium thailandense]NJC72014.1 STAS domain-containing protein [Planosporangium thailandense]